MDNVRDHGVNAVFRIYCVVGGSLGRFVMSRALVPEVVLCFVSVLDLFYFCEVICVPFVTIKALSWHPVCLG